MQRKTKWMMERALGKKKPHLHLSTRHSSRVSTQSHFPSYPPPTRPHYHHIPHPPHHLHGQPDSTRPLAFLYPLRAQRGGCLSTLTPGRFPVFGKTRTLGIVPN